MVKASTRYVWIGMNVASRPMPTNPVPRIGASQKTCLSAVQPYRNTANILVHSRDESNTDLQPIGMRKAPGIIGGKRYSAFISPFFDFIFTIRSLAKPKMMTPHNDPTPMPKNVRPTVP